VAVQVLQGEGDLGDVKEGYIVREAILFPQQSENLSSLNEIEDEIDVQLVLKSLNQVNNKRMLDASQDVFLVFDMVYLFKFDDLFLRQHLERKTLSVQDGEVDLSEGACSDDPD